MTSKEQDLLQNIPAAPWCGIKGTLPQTIAHRGFKARYPENSLRAMQEAVEVGAHALETDVHLTADGVVVLSHDPTLKRCFGKEDKIKDCLWEDIAPLQSTRQPSEPMARLVDLLEWLAHPSRQDTWVLLDIKTDDEAHALITAVGKALESVKPSIPWQHRIMLGCWNATFIKTAASLLPGYAISHISFSLHYSRSFLNLPNIGFNMLQRRLAGPFGKRFMRDVYKAGRPLFVWTVNDEYWMEWCLGQNDGDKRINGVISDDPELFLQVCDRWQDEKNTTNTSQNLSLRETARRTWEVCTVYILFGVFFLLRRHQGKLDYMRETKQQH